MRKNELDLISKMLSVDFIGRDRIIEQINKAQILRNNTEFYLSIRFQASKCSSPIDTYVRVPVEMIIYKKDCPPIQVLLHIINGFIDEIEVFFADSSPICESINIDNNDVVDVIVDSSLIKG